MISHLVELRKRLLRYVLILLLAFGLCSWQSDLLFSILSAPLRHALGPHPMMVFTAPHEAFVTYLRVGIFFSFFLTFPWLLAEVWAFVVPGLYEHERRVFTPLLLIGAMLFYGGGLFAYFGVFPFAFKFFFSFASGQITALPSLKESLTLFMRMLFAFGITYKVFDTLNAGDVSADLHVPMWTGYALASLGIIAATILACLRWWQVVFRPR